MVSSFKTNRCEVAGCDAPVAREFTEELGPVAIHAGRCQGHMPAAADERLPGQRSLVPYRIDQSRWVTESRR